MHSTHSQRSGCRRRCRRRGCLYTPSRPRNGFIIDHILFLFEILSSSRLTSALFLIHTQTDSLARSLTHTQTLSEPRYSAVQHTAFRLISSNVCPFQNRKYRGTDFYLAPVFLSLFDKLMS